MEDVTLQPNDSTHAWDVLAQCVDTFTTAWRGAAAPPPLREYLPADPPHVRGLVLVELIKVDLEQRWRGRREPRTLEKYLEEFPEIAKNGELPCDLIYEEYHIRKQSGDTVDVHQYFERFPRQASVLGRLLGIEAPHLSTTLVTGERPAEADPGERIDDFQLLSQLGKGAFATVWKARQLSMQRIVALKISSDQGVEPQTMAKLEHDHIVRVYDQRLLPERKTRLLYMQYVAGGTLQAAIEWAGQIPPAARSGKTILQAVDHSLDKQGELPPVDSSARKRLAALGWSEAVCRIGSRMASALHYAHQRNVLHRDIKPANVLLDAEGQPKLVDFNVSFCSELEGITAAAYFGGSLAYMSPEQIAACQTAKAAAGELDGRSDIYSLGVLLWELLTGSRPFDDRVSEHGFAATLDEMRKRRLEGLPAQALARLPADAPPGLEQVLVRCLAPQPKDRYAHAGELARQLDLCLQLRAQRLLGPRPGGLRAWARRWPIVGLLLAGLPANAFMGGLNIFFNLRSVVEALLHEKVLTDADVDFFRNVQIPFTNLVLFPFGILFLVWVGWPLFRAVRRQRDGDSPPEGESLELAGRCLAYGDTVALVGWLEWIAAGFLFPAWMHAHTGRASSTMYVHFISSQFLCGLIAGTLSFFLVTFFALRVIYPVIVPLGAGDSAVAEKLMRLSGRANRYFFASVAVFFLAMIFLVLIPTGGGEVDVKEFFVILGVLGLVAFGLAYRLNQAIQRDLDILVAAATPLGETFGLGSTTDTLRASRPW